jgi:hypothetical protein
MNEWMNEYTVFENYLGSQHYSYTDLNEWINKVKREVQLKTWINKKETNQCDNNISMLVSWVNQLEMKQFLRVLVELNAKNKCNTTQLHE